MTEPRRRVSGPLATVVLSAAIALASGLVAPVQALQPGVVDSVVDPARTTTQVLPKRPMIAPKSRQVHSKTAQRIKGRAVGLEHRKVRVEVKLYGKYRKGAKKKLLTWHKVKRVKTDAKGRYSFIFKTGGKRWWMRVWAPGDAYYRPTYARRVQTGFYSG